ncbi:MAG TPA: 3'-5' exonuclease [Candidatus Bathyarchaeia archaeon]|nr:3'-5' exonuclease [Candidatus Bathyarchaeia archaeon]
MPNWLRFGGGRDTSDSRFPKDMPLREVRYAVVDTELTSLDARSNRLLSIGAIAMDGAKIRMAEQFYRVVNPGVHVPAESVLIHQLRPNDVEKGVAPEQALGELRRFIEGRVVVGHFVQIDMQALRKELGDQQQTLSNPAVDTAKAHRWILQNGPWREDIEHRMANLSLAQLAKVYDLDFHEAHHALQDAFVAARLWQKLMAKLETMKVATLGELLKAAKA